MAIRFTKYINITSGVGAGTQVATRDLIGRLFTTNTLLPSNSYIEFDTAEEVGDYFGTSSEEFKRAEFYFSFISKNITAPKKISYARWVDEDTAPMIFGARLTVSLSALQAITNGSFTLTIGGTTNEVSGLNFSGAASLAAVAALIETGINAESGGTMWSAATVEYDSTRGSFNFVGGSEVDAAISVSAGTTGTNIATTIGWLPHSINGSAGAIWSDGQTTESITNVLTNSAEASDNFGSFLFMPPLTLDQITEASTWNSLQNVKFMFMSPVDGLENAELYYEALASYEGTGVTLSITSNQYPEQFPMMILAATDYNAANSTQNYMYQQTKDIPLTPSVTNTQDSDAYDALRTNYYGQTQTAGRSLSFYQKGILMGSATAPIDMNTYANEIWFKDAAGAALMTLFLALPKISANAQGVGQILSTLQSVINLALTNGTISINGILTDTQKLYINQITNDPKAWYQVQNLGYWVNCVIESVTNGDVIEYHAKYTLVYKKDDVVRKVDGTHILI